MNSHQLPVTRVISKFVADFLACLRFYSRLPIPSFKFERNPYGAEIMAHIGALPLAGAVIGGLGALTLLASLALGLALPLAATLTILGLAGVTGGFHEDGLADFADSTGGTTRAMRLEILKDSRIGSFGTLALIGSIFLRALSLWVCARHNLASCCLVLIATGGVSRTLGLLPLVVLPPARAEGAGFSAQSARPPLRGAAVFALALSLLPLLAGASLGRVLAALMGSLLAVSAVSLLARRLFGGQTGDVAGAAQQVAEITTYLVFAARV